MISHTGVVLTSHTASYVKAFSFSFCFLALQSCNLSYFIHPFFWFHLPASGQACGQRTCQINMGQFGFWWKNGVTKVSRYKISSYSFTTIRKSVYWLWTRSFSAFVSSLHHYQLVLWSCTETQTKFPHITPLRPHLPNLHLILNQIFPHDLIPFPQNKPALPPHCLSEDIRSSYG